MTFCSSSQHCKPGIKTFALFTALITICAFVHGVWYLWALPIAAFFFAGQFRGRFCSAGAWLAGIIFAALLTGHPVNYFSQGLRPGASHGRAARDESHAGGRIAAVRGRHSCRHHSRRCWSRCGRWRNWMRPPFARNPAFWLMCGCWILGFRVSRFWEDWGWPALMVLIATEIQFLLLAKFAADSFRRLLLVMILAVATFLAVTSDLNSRWTQSLTWQFLSTAEHPELAGWMPERMAFYTRLT